MRKWSLLCALLLAVAPVMADDAPPLPDAGQVPSIDLSAPAAAPADAGVPAPPADASMQAPPAADAAAIPAPPADASMQAPPADAASASAAPAPPAADNGVPAPPADAASAAPAPPAADNGVPAPPADAASAAPSAPAPEAAAPAPQVATSQVSVAKGQNLWSIAESGAVYGDHWLWPLLYIYNRDKIVDPDLIEPGWQLLVKADVPADVKQQQAAKAQETPRYVPHTTPRSHLPIEY